MLAQPVDFTRTDANLTAWRSGVDGGAGYPWPRNGLVSVPRALRTIPDTKLLLDSILEAVDAIQTCSGLSLSTLSISFLLALYGLISIDLLPSFSRAAKGQTFVV